MMEIWRIDDMGRMYIPASVRRACGWEAEDMIEVTTDGETVTLKKYEPEEGC